MEPVSQADTAWRLVRSAPMDGAHNMAVDEAILCAVVLGRVPPTVRFYAWAPGCLSLGRAQPLADVDLEAVRAAGFGLVRRPTGGRAVLHVDELAYSIAAPAGEPCVAGSVIESTHRLSRGLVHGLVLLGVDGVAAGPRTGERRPAGPVCFEAPSDYEVACRGRKLVGSAQMRVQGGVLQHGALPLHGDVARICPLLASRPDPARVRARATTLAEALGAGRYLDGETAWSEVAGALAAGFAAALGVRFELGELTREEQVQAGDLRAGKYAAEAWTHKA